VAVIVPIRGLRYNPNKISFISRVVAPPYDILDDEQVEKLQARDPHNVVRLTMGKTPAAGRPQEHYGRAAELFSRWRQDGVLVRDEEPSIYVVEQAFRLAGQDLVRRGFVAGVLLEELGKGGVLPHERTMKAPRADRYKLMEACRANLSQVLAIYPDADCRLDRLVADLCTGPQIYSFRDADDIAYRGWRVTDPARIAELAALIRERPLVIADGHHRYESAWAYCQDRRAAGRPLGEAPEDYVSAFCVSLSNPGLRSLPTHRRAKAAAPLPEDGGIAALQATFDARRVETTGPEFLQRDFDEARGGAACIGCLLSGGELWLLAPRAPASLRARFPASADPWWELPVATLHYVILPDMLGIQPGSDDESLRVEYRASATEVCWGVESGAFDVGFLLPPTEPAAVERVATQGERLPLKSTYFHPKPPSGLVIYPHD